MQQDNKMRQDFKIYKETIRTRPSIDTDLLRSLCIKNEKQFNVHFDRLCQHWWDKVNSRSNTEAGKLVNNIIAFRLKNPVILAIIADDVDTFIKHYTKKSGDIFCFEFCCLCGSGNIINDVFLKQTEMQKCLSLSKNAIGYALSSGDTKLALLLAETAIKLGKTDPGFIALYSSGEYECANAIKNMFSTMKKADVELNHSLNTSTENRSEIAK